MSLVDQNGSWLKYELDNAAEFEAYCNNGEEYVYIMKPPASGVDDWVMYLKGGGACANDATCTERWQNQQHRMKPVQGWPGNLYSGIMRGNASKNPHFYKWGKIYMHYCSSDLWYGDKDGPGIGQNGWFKGKNIVAAVIDELKNHPAFDPDTFILAGGSAGARGVIQNLDSVAAALPGVTVLGVMDAAIQPYELAGFEQTGEDTADTGMNPDGACAYWNCKPDDSCVSAKSVDYCRSHSKILFGDFDEEADEYLGGHLTTPRFGYADQHDRHYLSGAGIVKTDPEAAAAAAAVREVLADPDVVTGAYSTRRGAHVFLISDNFHSVKIAESGSSPRKAYDEILDNWVESQVPDTWIKQ